MNLPASIALVLLLASLPACGRGLQPFEEPAVDREPFVILEPGVFTSGLYWLAGSGRVLFTEPLPPLAAPVAFALGVVVGQGGAVDVPLYADRELLGGLELRLRRDATRLTARLVIDDAEESDLSDAVAHFEKPLQPIALRLVLAPASAPARGVRVLLFDESPELLLTGRTTLLYDSGVLRRTLPGGTRYWGLRLEAADVARAVREAPDATPLQPQPG